MPIPAHFSPSGLDFSQYQYKEDYSDVFKIAMQPKYRIMLIDMIREGTPTSSNPYYITDDVLEVTTVTLNGNVVAGTTTWTLTSGDAAYLQNGDMLRAMTAGKSEVVQINGEPDTVNHQITVTRNVSSDGGAEAHATGAEFYIIRSVPAGSEADMMEFIGTTRRENYTGTISHTIGLAASDMEDEPQSYSTPELDRQEAKILRKLRGELEDLLLFGPGQARANGAHGQMKGFRKQILAGGGSNYDTGTANPKWSYELIDGKINWLVQQGVVDESSNLVCVCPATGYSLAGYWGAAAVVSMASDLTYGFETNTIHSTLGLQVPIVWSSRMPSDEFYLISLDHFEKMPKGSRRLLRYVKPAGRDLQDYEARRILGEWGNRLYYPTKAHYIHKNVRFVR